MWDLIVSVPDHCLSFYFTLLFFLRHGSTAVTVPISHSNFDFNGCLQNKGVVRRLLGCIWISYTSEVFKFLVRLQSFKFMKSISKYIY